MKKRIPIFIGAFLSLCLVHAQVADPYEFHLEEDTTDIEPLGGGSSAFADVDGDGSPDLLLTGVDSADNTMTELYLNGSGEFNLDTNNTLPGLEESSVAFSDVDNDGDQDVFMAGRGVDGAAISRLYLNDGAGNFSYEFNDFADVSKGDVAFADVDGDGLEDLFLTGDVWSNSGVSHLYMNDGNGSFSENTYFAFPGLYESSVAFADVDNDNDLDLVISGTDNSNSGLTELYLNDGSGNYQLDTSNTFVGVMDGALAFSDMTTSGDQLLFVSGMTDIGDAVSQMYRNNGNGNFILDNSTNFDGIYSGDAEFVDINGDGYKDLIITGASNPAEGNVDVVVTKLYKNEGNGDFTELVDVALDGAVQSSISYADVDGNGRVDVFLSGMNEAGAEANPISELYLNYEVNTYIYDGTSWTPQDPSGVSTRFDNIEVNSGSTSLTANTQINNLTVDAGATLYIGDVLYLNGTMSNNGDLIFTSDENSTGQIGPLAAGTNIADEVTVERYVPASNRAFRFISPSVTTNTSIKENWQEGVNNPDISTNLNPNPGYGVHITGSTTGQNGFDATPSGNPSLFTFDNTTQSWNAVSSTDNTELWGGYPYRLFVRGSRGVDVTDNETTPDPTTLRMTGALSIGTQGFANFSDNQGDFNFFGNPFQAIVDMTAVLENSTNLNENHYYIWDPNLNEHGAYVTVDLSGSGGAPTPSTSDANQYIQPGQAGFVRTLYNGDASILFEENDKAPEANPSDVFRSGELSTYMTVELQTEEAFINNGSIADALQVNFSPNESNEILPNDAAKLGNIDENLALVNEGNYLSIEYRSLPEEGEVLPLYIDQYRHLDYVYKVNAYNIEGVTAYLIDSYLNTQTEIDNEETAIVHFSIDPEIESSFAPDRFSIAFESDALVTDSFVQDDFSIYPNPLQGSEFYVQVPSSYSGRQMEISMHNLMGQEVYSSIENIDGNDKVRITKPNLSSGVYLVNIKAGNASSSHKLIIQ